MDVHPTKNVSIGIDPYPFELLQEFNRMHISLHDSNISRSDSSLQRVKQVQKRKRRTKRQNQPGSLFIVHLRSFDLRVFWMFWINLTNLNHSDTGTGIQFLGQRTSKTTCDFPGSRAWPWQKHQPLCLFSNGWISCEDVSWCLSKHRVCMGSVRMSFANQPFQPFKLVDLSERFHCDQFAAVFLDHGCTKASPLWIPQW